jgi:hypothetical protein
MRARKYPLEPLKRLKKDRAEAKTRELGGAIATREMAERRRREAEVVHEAERARADMIRHAERASLERGELTAKDLARGGTWEQRASVEDAQRARGVERSLRVEEKARAVEAKAQSDVALARAEVEATAHHEQRFLAAAKKAEEASEEEDLAEVVAGKPTR